MPALTAGGMGLGQPRAFPPDAERGVIFDRFSWTRVSASRNRLSERYEPVQPYFLLKLSERFPGAVFLDIGANIGAYGITMAAQDHIAQVHAFEPNPDCAVELRKNAELNSLSHKFVVSQLALSDAEGTADFARTTTYGGDAGLRHTHLFADRIQQVTKVQTRTLDAYWSERTGPIVIKIDVEGHEHCVIEGAKQVLERCTGCLQVEIHDQNPSKADTLALLADLGWHRVLKIGWDYYFSNDPGLSSDAERLRFVEDALSFLVDDSVQAARPVRRRVLPGVVVEVAREHVQVVRRLASLFSRKPRQ